MHALAGQGQAPRGSGLLKGSGSEGKVTGEGGPRGQRAAGPLCVYLSVSLSVSLCISVCARRAQECVPGPRARGHRSGLFAGGAFWRTHLPSRTRVFLQPLSRCSLLWPCGRRGGFAFLLPRPEALSDRGATRGWAAAGPCA